MKSDLAKAVDKQNALQPGAKETDVGVSIVRILEENYYGDERGRRKFCAPGDLLTTTANYAQMLVERGSACSPTANEVRALDEPEQVAEQTVTPFSAVDGVSETVAAALEATGATWEKIAEIPTESLQKVPGVGPKLAEKLKAKAQEVLDAASTD